MADPVYVAGMLAACVIASDWLARHTALRHAGTALIVIVVAAVLSNLRLMPTAGSVVYDGVFVHVAPLAIFWLLLRVNLRKVLQAGLRLLGLFLIGTAGTVAGVLVAMAILPEAPFGEHTAALGGMFVATYTGGSANLAAVALHYGVAEAGPLYAGIMAVDAGMTAVWMALCIAIPRWFGAATGSAKVEATDDPDREAMAPMDLAVLTALGLGTLWLSAKLSAVTSIPSMIVLTVIALVLAQLPPIARLAGARALGMFAIYVFLAVIGAMCDVAALAGLGALGLKLSVLASVCIGVHGAITFAAARLLKLGPVMAGIASQANIGGGTTALALARSLGREDLVLPGVLVGSVGTALGTFLGFWVASVL